MRVTVFKKQTESQPRAQEGTESRLQGYRESASSI
jgi:hypothetical protein